MSSSSSSSSTPRDRPLAPGKDAPSASTDSTKPSASGGGGAGSFFSFLSRSKTNHSSVGGSSRSRNASDSAPSHPKPTPSPLNLATTSRSFLSPQEENQATSGRLLQQRDTQQLVWFLLDARSAQDGTLAAEPKQVEMAAKALVSRFKKAESWTSLMAPGGQDDSALSPSSASSPTLSGPGDVSAQKRRSSSSSSTFLRPTAVFAPTTLETCPAQLMAITASLCGSSSPVAIRIAGFDLLASFISLSPRITTLTAADVGVFFSLVTERKSDQGIADIEARISCLRVMIQGNGFEGEVQASGDSPESNTNGWGDWTTVLNVLEAWEAELERGWELSLAGAGSTTPGSDQAASRHVPALAALLSLISLILIGRTTLFDQASLSTILRTFCRLAWNGLDLTLVASFAAAQQQDVALLDTAAASSSAPATGLGLDHYEHGVRGRLGPLGGPSSTVTGISRSPSLTRKGKPTTATTLSSPAPSARLLHAATSSTPHRPREPPPTTSTAPASPSQQPFSPTSPIATLLSPNFQSPALPPSSISSDPAHLPAIASPSTVIHPLGSEFLNLFLALIGDSEQSLPWKSLVSCCRLLFAMLSVGGPTCDQAWPVAVELFTKGYSDRFTLVLKGTLSGRLKASEEWGEQAQWEVPVVSGAVLAIRLALREGYSLRRTKTPAEINSLSTRSFASLELSSFFGQLCSAMSLERIDIEDDDVRERWAAVDMEILAIVEDILDDAAETGMDTVLGEGDMIIDVLDRMRHWVQRFRFPDGRPFIMRRWMERAVFDVGVPPLLKRYADVGRALPRCLTTFVELQQPDLPPPVLSYRHARHLVSVSQNLSEPVACIVLDTYKEDGVCLSDVSEQWLENISLLLSAFFNPPRLSSSSQLQRTFSEARQQTALLLFETVYPAVKEIPEDRSALIHQIILPLLEETLEKEKDPRVADAAWEVLVDAACYETIQIDEAEEEANAPGLTSSFERIRALIEKIACRTSCAGHRSMPERYTAPDRSAPPPSGLQSPWSPLSPIDSPSHEPPAFSLASLTSPPLSSDGHSPSRLTSGSSTGASTPTGLPAPRHRSCTSLHACLALISIFNRLVFGSGAIDDPASLGSISLSASRAILIFQTILALLRPSPQISSSRDASPTKMSEDLLRRPKLHASCPRGRLVLLQWLLRLRADTQHRVFCAFDVDVAQSAALIGRSVTAKDAGATSAPAESSEMTRRRTGRSAVGSSADGGGDERDRERGRNSSRQGRRDQSTSRSRVLDLGASRDVLENPLWQYEDELLFDVPLKREGKQHPEPLVSVVLNTFDPLREFANSKDLSRLPKGVWLPVSEYVEVLIQILDQESDWELVSLLLCYLPRQLVCQHFFCGGRAIDKVLQLVDSFNSWLGPGRLPITSRLPVGVKKADVLAVAYLSLDILVGFYRKLSPAQLTKTVKAFETGIANDEKGKVCVRALTAIASMGSERTSGDQRAHALDDLATALARDLHHIMDRLSTQTSSVSLAIHILEFVYAVSQNPSLYSNFTDEQYETVFTVAVNIISIHHESAAEQLSETRTVDEIAAYVTSQHMLQFAFFTIYPWFLSLSIAKRPRHIGLICEQLLMANRSSDQLDDRSEVCVDFLHRYTFSNADPRPSTSSIGRIVMPESSAAADKDTSTKLWVQGTTVLRVRTNNRTGWGRIETFTPSGTVSMMLKLENIPFIGLGEQQADLVSLTAVLAGDREAGDLGQNAESTIAHLQTTTPAATEEPRDGGEYVWTTTAPSQRRKAIAIDPAFIAQQIFPLPVQSTEPLRLITDKMSIRRIDSLDANYPVVDFHKIGVLYVGPGQTTEREIYSNTDGSQNYTRFLAGLGRVVKLLGQKDIPTGLDTSESLENGEYTYAFWDDVHVLAYHVATLMPNLDEGEKANLNKAKCIGNDFVRIVYNDSGREYAFDTIRTAFQYVNIVIVPHTTGSSRTHDDGDEHNVFTVSVQRAPGFPEFGPIGQYKVISAASLSSFVRQLSLEAELIAKIYSEIKDNGDNTSSWRRRLRALRQTRDAAKKTSSPMTSTSLQTNLLRSFTSTFAGPTSISS